MRKLSKVLLLSLLAFMMTIFTGLSSESLASAPWDGTTIDVNWFDDKTYDTTTEYTINTPEELMGLAAIVNGIYNPGITVIGDDEGTKISPVEYKDVLIIPFDGTKGNIRWGKYDFEGKTIKLGADLDMGGIYNEFTEKWDPNSPNYMPIGGSYSMVPNSPKTTLISSVFNGNFDGQGHRIDNIYFERYAPDHFGYSQALGFIGATGYNGKVDEIEELEGQEFPLPKGSSIKNITIGKGYMSGRRMVGSIVGRVRSSVNGTRVTNCSNEADIKGTDKKGIGGIVGSLWNKDSIVSYCYNKGSVTNTNSFITGGIVGSNEGKIKHCYNVGIVKSYDERTGRITDPTAAADIAKVVNGETSYAENCYWEERDDNRGRIGVSEYGSTGGTVVDCSAKTPQEMKSNSLVTLLNNEFKAYKFVAGEYPKLKQENTNQTVNISVKNIAGVEIIASNSGAVPYGNFVELKINADPGVVVEYFTVNGNRIDGDTIFADQDAEISVVTKEAIGYTLNLPPIDPDFSFQILKTGLHYENGEYSNVEDKEIFNGDKVFDGDIITVKKAISEGNANVRLVLETVNGAVKDYGPNWAPFYKVTTKAAEENNNAVDISFEKYYQSQNWIRYADTSWFDKAPDATVYEIKSHQELAGLSKILSVDDAKYKDVTFKGKTINLTTDIRFRNDKDQFQGENLPLIPIGDARPFEGTFNGNNYRISNVVMNETTVDNEAGLFAKLKGTESSPAVVKNLVVEGSIDLKEGGSYIGGLAGYAQHANISNVKSYMTINTERDVPIGGVIGRAESTTINIAENVGKINTKRGYVGGIAGSIDNKSTISQARNIGNLYQGPLVNTPFESAIGGIVGYSEGTMNKVANKGRIVGFYWTGGISGYSNNIIKDAYSIGEVTTLGSFGEENSVGTLVGKIDKIGDSLGNSYTTGKLNSRLGLNANKGYIGLRDNRALVTNSHYLENTIDSVSGMSNILSKTMTEMKSSEFINTLGNSFTEDSYHINKGYPVFTFEKDLVDEMTIEDLRKQNKDEIENYPVREYYEEENLAIVDSLIDEYLGKFDRFTNEMPNTPEIKTEMRDLVNEFKGKIDEIPKKNVDEDAIARELLDSMLVKAIEDMSARLTDAKLPQTNNNALGQEALEQAQVVKAKNSDATDIEIEEAVRNIYEAMKLLPLDNEPPLIFNLDPVNINKGATFDPLAGIVVSDNYVGAPEPTVRVEGSVDTNSVGTYELSYIATDSVGNSATYKRTIRVVDSEVELSKYDLNGDGKVDSLDSILLMNVINEGEPYSEFLKKYDLNGDKTIDSLDSIILRTVINEQS